MLSYIKNLSTFRLFLIFLLALAAGINLYGRFRESASPQGGKEQRQRIVDAMLECADKFGAQLAAQESLAVALAMQYEMLGDAANRDNVGNILEKALQNSSECVEGIGLITSGGENEPRTVAFLPKGGVSPQENIDTLLSHRTGDRQVTAREVNMDRRVTWTLLAGPPSGAGSRFGTLLTVSFGKGTGFAGGSLVKASLGWLADLLRSLQTAGAEVVFCITPQRDVLWLENGRMYYDKDLESRVHKLAPTIERAKQYIDQQQNTSPPGYLKADILGTGWHLFLMDVNATGAAAESMSLSLIVVLVVGGALIVDAILSSSAPSRKRHATSLRTKIIPQPESDFVKPDQGLLRHIYSLLFKYRMIDPNQERIDSELRVARQIQFSLVPDSFPSYSEWREFDLYSVLSPAREVGGDYYDFFMLDSDRMVLTVGDVSGKGVPAALYMAVCRTAFRTIARETTAPGELLSRLNDMLVRDNQSGLYVTLATFIVDLPTGNCEYVIAGHPAPLWRESAKEATHLVDAPRETFIGMKAGLHFPVGTLRLSPGDTLLLYTDGVTEARNVAGTDLDYDGLKSLFDKSVQEIRCQNLIADLEQSVRNFMDHQEQLDDITLLAFRYWGPGGQKILKKRERESVRMNLKTGLPNPSAKRL